MKYSSSNNYKIVGLLLFGIYILQIIIPWNSEAILELQDNDNYKIWSGILLLLIILSQWAITYARFVHQKSGTELNRLIRIHKMTGAVSPLFYLIHSISPGYGLLLFLTFAFFINHIWSLLPNESSFWIRMFPIWLITHIFLAVLIMILSAYHIYIAFAYK